MNHPKRIDCRRFFAGIRGATLLEASVLMGIFALGALGTLAMQGHVLRASHLAAQHVLADLMALDLRERLWAQGMPSATSPWIESWRRTRDCRVHGEHFCLPDLEVGFTQEDNGFWIELSWSNRQEVSGSAARLSLRWPVAVGDPH
jgi:hypothetical protein